MRDTITHAVQNFSTRAAIHLTLQNPVDTGSAGWMRVSNFDRPGPPPAPPLALRSFAVHTNSQRGTFAQYTLSNLQKNNLRSFRGLATILTIKGHISWTPCYKWLWSWDWDETTDSIYL